MIVNRDFDYCLFVWIISEIDVICDLLDISELRIWVTVSGNELGENMNIVLKKVGKYEVGRTIGEGTFAKVKFARNTETGESVAVKVMAKSTILKHKMVDQVLYCCINAWKSIIYKVYAYACFFDSIHMNKNGYRLITKLSMFPNS